MQCLRCHQANEAAAKFCEQCAAPLSPACGAVRSSPLGDRQVLSRMRSPHEPGASRPDSTTLRRSRGLHAQASGRADPPLERRA